MDRPIRLANDVPKQRRKRLGSIWQGVDCPYLHLFGSQRERESDVERYELSKLSFRCRHQALGNNYFSVQANYPKFRERSGTKENQIKRVNDCFQRSLNGQALDSTSKEMKAILAYIKWVGQDVPKKTSPKGAGIFKLKYLDRAADPLKGKEVYQAKCQSCHQADGQGLLAEDGKSYTYPPLWGPHSYNIGAGLYRISNFAGFVKYNMPLGVTYNSPQLSNEEAWDVAAFVNSMPRPSKDLSKDWPRIAGKPLDHPFGPYADKFSEARHKYGPFKGMKK